MAALPKRYRSILDIDTVQDQQRVEEAGRTISSLPCESAFDGESAIKCVIDNQFMPDVGKIIVFTASNDRKDLEITNALGAHHFVTKPPTHESLKDVLSEGLAA